MYGVASHHLGVATGTPWLRTLGLGEAWVALAVWAAVFAAMLLAAVRPVSYRSR
jgi:tellurite resistance protein TehA-like permease